MDNKKQRKNSQSFLDKFQGKRNAVSKQGLMQLLEQKRQSFQNNKLNTLEKHNKIVSNHLKASSKERQIVNTEPKAIKKETYTQEVQPIKTENLRNQQEKNIGKREHAKQSKSVEFTPNRLRLPSIDKISCKSNNVTLDKRNSEQAQSSRSKGQLSRISNHESLILNNFAKKMQLDKYALRHLQFLNKFERQLQNSQSSAHKKTIISENQ